jgi:hypothetical protein
VDGRQQWRKMSLEVAGLILALAFIGYVVCTFGWLSNYVRLISFTHSGWFLFLFLGLETSLSILLKAAEYTCSRRFSCMDCNIQTWCFLRL